MHEWLYLLNLYITTFSQRMTSNTINCFPTATPLASTIDAIYPLTSFSSFISVFSSSLDLLAWLNLKFIIAGLLLEFTRHMGVVQASCDKVLDLISVRATFCQGDYSYRQSLNLFGLVSISHASLDWVMAWLDQQKSWSMCLIFSYLIAMLTTSDCRPT